MRVLCPVVLALTPAKATEPQAYRGRNPTFTRKQVDSVRDMLTSGAGVSAIASATGLSRQTIYRLRDDPAWAESVLAAWSD